jgi:hypothetical protein
MRVAIHVVRDREPWGPGQWYAELVDVMTKAVVGTTDFERGRYAAEAAGRTEAMVRGLEVL